MDLGFALPTSGSWAMPENITTIAQTADRLGYRTLWNFQRVLFPQDSDMAAVYRSVLDPLVTLGFAAAVTERARLGVAVVNGPFYAPALLAKQLAAIDVLSKGRLDAGIGLGWLPEEHAAVGLPMERRGRRFEEWLDCLDVLLTEDPASFKGEYYTVPPSHLSPAPVQRPRPPILLGGRAERALRRAGARADGWISSSRLGLDEVRAAVTTVRAAAEQAGRPPEAIRCVVRGVTALREKPVDETDRPPLRGTLDQIREGLERFAACGVDEVFLDLNFDSERVGNPDVDPARSMELASTVLEGLGS